MGIAEAARDEAIRTATACAKLPSGRRAAERVMIQGQIGEIEVALQAVQATFAHHARAIDAAVGGGRPRAAELPAMRQLNAQIEAAKIFIERSCVQLVDRCLTVSGGAGYLTKSPLARHCREVRALSFMFPQATETLQYVGQVALGIDPKPDI